MASSGDAPGSHIAEPKRGYAVVSGRPSVARRVARRLGLVGPVAKQGTGGAGGTKQTASVAGVRELIDVAPIPADPGARLNLIVPAVDEALAFGGIRTALDLFDALPVRDVPRRVISVRAFDSDVARGFPGWAIGTGDDPLVSDRHLVGLDRTSGPAPLRVGPDDVFIATFWPTAALIDDIRAWQSTTFGSVPARSAYLIQDFEPGFYPRSAQYLLALGTYGRPTSTVAVFNTSLLQQSFHDDGIRFDHEFAFEPRLSDRLRARMPGTGLPGATAERSRTIVVYGRPSKPRNAFPLLVDGLRAWVAGRPDAPEWSVVSAGQAHDPLPLGRGMSLTSVGKLDMDAYATLLRTSALGCSLMVSPHPSYPPLEMAQMGMLVLTNRFGRKDLSTWHPNITSIGDVRAAGIAADLDTLCDRFLVDPGGGDRAAVSWSPDAEPEVPFPFAGDLVRLLLS